MTAELPAAEPWERLPDESSRAYEGFREFRDLGPARSLRGLVATNRHSARSWSLRFRWTERARAWDAELYRVEDARRLDAIRTMDEQHQRAARAMIGAGLRALASIEDLTPHQAARFIDVGTRLERSALLGERQPPPGRDPLDDDGSELSPLERIARELAGTA